MKDPQKTDQRRLMMMNDPIPKVVFKMAIPTIIAFLINSIYSLADTYFVSGLGNAEGNALRFKLGLVISRENTKPKKSAVENEVNPKV